MTLILDPAILAAKENMAIGTTIVVDLSTPTPQRWTNRPGGLTVPSILGVLTVTNGGSGYTSAPIVTFSGGGGQAADAIAIISGGAVTALVIISRGWGYTSAPSIALSGGGGTGAAATATIGVTFNYADVAFSPIAESADGSVITGTLTFGNAENTFTNLVTDAANASAPVAVQKVWRDTAGAPIASEIWFEGHLGGPAFEGNQVTIDCAADVGRSGISPTTEWRNVLHSHTPPDDSMSSPLLAGVS